MDELTGARSWFDRYGKEVSDEILREFAPMLAPFLSASPRTQTAEILAAWRAYVTTEAGAMPAIGPYRDCQSVESQRTQTAKIQAALWAYVATGAGAMHARCLAQRKAHPDTAITSEQAQAIVRPLLDPARTAPPVAGQRHARFWLSLEDGDAAKEDMLRSLIATAAVAPVFHEAVRLIAIDQLRTGKPLHHDLRLWIADALAGKKPAGRGGRPTNMNRDAHIVMAVYVLQDLGLIPTKADGSDRERSGCGIVGEVLELPYNAVASVWTGKRHK